jgi:hypothetical protein
MARSSLTKTPNSSNADGIAKFFDTAKHIVLCLVAISCYVIIGAVIVIYVLHFILPENIAWLTDIQKKMISDILSGGFVAFVIGKITDKF